LPINEGGEEEKGTPLKNLELLSLHERKDSDYFRSLKGKKKKGHPLRKWKGRENSQGGWVSTVL